MWTDVPSCAMEDVPSASNLNVRGKCGTFFPDTDDETSGDPLTLNFDLEKIRFGYFGARNQNIKLKFKKIAPISQNMLNSNIKTKFKLNQFLYHSVCTRKRKTPTPLILFTPGC